MVTGAVLVRSPDGQVPDGQVGPASAHAAASSLQPVLAAQPPVAARPPVRTSRASVVDPEAAPPRRVRIESIGVDSTLVGLRRLRDGTLEVPADFGVAGWYRGGVAPGDAGPAVLVGHVDSYDGPAVFFRLGELRRGDRITVARTDGSRVVFAVYASERVSKSAFPTERVYGDTAGPELRLLTCGGAFDEQTKHYEDNLVVYARQVRG